MKINKAEIIFLLMFITLYCIVKLPKNFVNNFSQYIQLMTFVVIAVGSIITIYNLKLVLDDKSKSYTEIYQNKFSLIDKMFMENKNLNRLYHDIYKYIPSNYIQETPDILRCEHQMSNMIFQTISDIYEKYDNIDVEWLNTFKDLLKSNILRNNWNYLKNEYNNKTKEFINTLLI